MNKITIEVGSIVITDTTTGNVVAEYPKSDIYFRTQSLEDDNQIELYDTNGVIASASIVFTSPLASTVDKDDVVFTKSTWRAFARENLGFNPLVGASKSQIFPFAADNSYQVNSNSNSYEKLAAWEYEGTNVIGTIRKIFANCWNTGGGTAGIRIYDATNANVIAEIPEYGTADELNISEFPSVSNLPKNKAIFELHMKRNGGGVVAYCANIRLEY